MTRNQKESGLRPPASAQSAEWKALRNPGLRRWALALQAVYGTFRRRGPMGAVRAEGGKSGSMKPLFAALLLGSAVVLFVIVAAGQQPCRPQRPTAMTPFDTCKYLPLGSGIHAPRPVSAPDPQLPEAARKANLNGNVVVALAINEKGSVNDVKVVRSSDRRFEPNAIDAVKQWEFAPATKDGKPMAVQMNAEISFELH